MRLSAADVSRPQIGQPGSNLSHCCADRRIGTGRVAVRPAGASFNFKTAWAFMRRCRGLGPQVARPRWFQHCVWPGTVS